jgi:hypothetical protein
VSNHDVGPQWEPRVSPEKIRRLYETDARGILDEELLDDIAFALYARCESILTVTEAVRGRVKCPRCSRLCDRLKTPTGETREDVLRCGDCAWETTWGAYHQSYRDRRLIGRGAVDAWRAYVEQFPHVRSPREKMLLIDGLIHAMHKPLSNSPQWPAAVNLIEGNVPSIVNLLEGLAYGQGSTPGTQEVKVDWYRIRERQAAGKTRK